MVSHGVSIINLPGAWCCRYNPALPIETNAVLILDDDIVLPPSTIASLFARWSIDRRHLVGIRANQQISSRSQTGAGLFPT